MLSLLPANQLSRQSISMILEGFAFFTQTLLTRCLGVEEEAIFSGFREGKFYAVCTLG